MPANYVLLERIELNDTAASVTFNNIPQSGYTDLKIVASARGDNAGSAINSAIIRFNGDSGANYSWRQLRGDGASAISSSSTGANNGYLGYVEGATATANTFNNMEIYVPNYLGSQQKSFSVDNAEENNATTAYAHLVANLWTGTSAISSVTIDANGSNFVQYSTFSLYGLAAVGTTPVIAPKASGGNITTDGTYWIHTFNSTGAFVPQTSLSCDYLVIAGGGGGSTYAGGGGGAGGYKYATSQSLSATSYTVTVGAGGAGYQGSGSGLGSNGANSSFNSETMIGGGRGGGNTNYTGGTGGSGGGAAGISTAVGGAGTSGQGFAGGDSPGNSGGGGGGGGSAAVGSNGTNTEVGGNGGTGTANSITGTSVTRAGGGGGAGSTGAAGTGAAGGGNGGKGVGVAGSNATTNTGSGGGGCWLNASAGNGGSGIVIIRYLAA